MMHQVFFLSLKQTLVATSNVFHQHYLIQYYKNKYFYDILTNINLFIINVMLYC